MAGVPKARTHDHRLVPMGLKVVVDSGNGLHAGVIGGVFNNEVDIGVVPISDAANEGRDEEYSRVSTSTGLLEAEDQRGVAVDVALLQRFRRANAFPGRRHLNQYTVAAYTCVVIKPDQLLGFGNGRLGVKRQTRVNFRADDARDHLIDLCSDTHGEAVDLIRNPIL